jgi:hypothetical protein
VEVQGAKPTGGAIEGSDESLGKAQKTLIDTREIIKTGGLDITKKQKCAGIKIL